MSTYSKYFSYKIFQVKRFNDEVVADVVGLTGMRFFHITRKLMLTVIAKVITYEIFLIQLQNDNQSDESKENFCGV